MSASLTKFVEIQAYRVQVTGLKLDRSILVCALVDAVEPGQEFAIQIQLERVHPDGAS